MDIGDCAVNCCDHNRWRRDWLEISVNSFNPDAGTIAALSRSSSMVGNKYMLWTQEDDRRLLELRASGRSVVSMAAALKRSKGAIRARLNILRALAKSPQLSETPNPSPKLSF
jgi:hypothetical protein